jgi:Flp pilus assembly protein TadG
MFKKFLNQKEKGQGFVELALILPVLLIIVAGTVDLSRFYLTYTSLRDAAQEGANYGSLDPTRSTEIIARVRGFSNDTSTVGVDITFASPCAIGAAINVKASQDFEVSTPMVGAFIGQTIPVSANVTNAILSCP